MSSRVATHQDPIWRSRSNFIIRARITDSDVRDFEQLWARRVEEYQFELCCIPFFVYDLALGDIVETDGSYTVKAVAIPSGRYAFRVWFGDAADPPRDDIVRDLSDLGALTEWSSPNLLAVDAANDEHAQQVADLLHEHQGLGQLLYETGRS